MDMDYDDAYDSPAYARYVVMGLGMTVLPFLPAAHFFLDVGYTVAERLLYLPAFATRRNTPLNSLELNPY